MMKRNLSLAVIWGSCLTGLTATIPPLAITEVLPSSSGTFQATNQITRHADFWELTNYGTNEIDLNGFTFSDAIEVKTNDTRHVFQNLTIDPGQSIIFVRTNSLNKPHSDPDVFRRWWWGDDPSEWPDIDIQMYPSHVGFDSERDAVKFFAPNGTLVDKMEWSSSLRGRTFISDPVTGRVGTLSRLEDDVSFLAKTADDIGSPGVSTPRIPLQILQCPESQFAVCGQTVTLTVSAIGLPRPHYEWRHKGTPISDSNRPDLVLPNVSAKDVGDYTVHVFNGVDAVDCGPATLTVSLEESPPIILAPLQDQEIFIDEDEFFFQDALFEVAASGCPPPQFLWQTNGIEVVGARSSLLRLRAPDPGLSGLEVCVVVSNALGSATNCGRLDIRPLPILSITEVMAAPTDEVTSLRADWFELFNRDTQPHSLEGYRILDSTYLSGAFTNTNKIVIQPGESIIFVDGLSPEEFRAWWGEYNLPPDLQIISWFGFGLNSDGNAIYIWNPPETDPFNPMLSVSFGRSDIGVSQWFLPPFYDISTNSELGSHGAFQALDGGDIGSPGYPGVPWLTALRREGEELDLKCYVIKGRSYSLQSQERLPVEDPTGWARLMSFTATNWVMHLSVPLSDMESQRFYRLKEL